MNNTRSVEITGFSNINDYTQKFDTQKVIINLAAN